MYFFPYISHSNCGDGFVPNSMGCTMDNNICGLKNFLLCLVLNVFNICSGPSQAFSQDFESGSPNCMWAEGAHSIAPVALLFNVKKGKLRKG